MGSLKWLPFFMEGVMRMIELICGDCLKYLDKLQEKYSGRDIILVSDVPFNIGYGYATYKDRLPQEDYLKMLKDVFDRGVPFVIIHYPESLSAISSFLAKTPTRVCSWVYNSNTGRQHRDVAFFDVKPNFGQVSQPYKNLNDKRIIKRIKEGKTCKLYDWWNVNQVKNVSKEKTAHPCQMPLEVMKNIVGVLPKGSLIVDPFMGSGTTGVACKELGYDFVGIEIDEGYFKIAEGRMKDGTG